MQNHLLLDALTSVASIRANIAGADLATYA
jgi:hypothetical protein